MPSEKEWQTYFSPKKTLATLGLKNGMDVADLGCGYGTFAIGAARTVGRRGKVYAIDIDPRMLRVVSKRAREKHLANVIPILADLSKVKRRVSKTDATVDFALLANIIHGAKNKVRLLKVTAKMLKPCGVVAVLNWNVEKTPRGPPMRMRPTKEKTVEWLTRAGYVSPAVMNVPPYHYAVVARLPNSRIACA
ncbi:MAG: class I SAM-dependent methyltransferase [Nitrososphaerota archaeon]|nr:class I SAM-dependent methyltransferase [Nitrososphaerota archaeon]